MLQASYFPAGEEMHVPKHEKRGLSRRLMISINSLRKQFHSILYITKLRFFSIILNFVVNFK